MTESQIMRLSDIDKSIPIYGNVAFRGECPVESAEQMTFFNWIRREHPHTWGRLAFHPRNEGLKLKGQFAAVQRHAAEGMTAGVADIVIPGRVAFVCELKRRDITISDISQDQVDYLMAAKDAGAFACVALGVDGAREAFQKWLTE